VKLNYIPTSHRNLPPVPSRTGSLF
jgi:hypothetical protein